MEDHWYNPLKTLDITCGTLIRMGVIPKLWLSERIWHCALWMAVWSQTDHQLKNISVLKCFWTWYLTAERDGCKGNGNERENKSSSKAWLRFNEKQSCCFSSSVFSCFVWRSKNDCRETIRFRSKQAANKSHSSCLLYAGHVAEQKAFWNFYYSSKLNKKSIEICIWWITQVKTYHTKYTKSKCTLVYLKPY